MANIKNASYGMRYENSKSLVTSLKKYTKYNPTADDIKTVQYEEYLESMEANMNPYKNANGALSNAVTENQTVFKKLNETVKAVRSEIAEITGKKSPQYNQVSYFVKLITGQNISDRSRKSKVNSNIKDGGNGEVKASKSVSQLNFESRLHNFRTLIGLLRNYSFYNPSYEEISINSLVELQNALNNSLAGIAEKESELVVERSKMKHYFDGKNGITDRARRAKMHVSRIYGRDSQEYRALTKKMY